MADMVIQLPNSPGVDVTVKRGGTDPITKEPLSERNVTLSWDVTYTVQEEDDDGNLVPVEKTRTEIRTFEGP